MVLDRGATGACINTTSTSDRSSWLFGTPNRAGFGTSSSSRSSGGGCNDVLHSSVARANNSWYVSEHPSEPVDRRRAAALSPAMHTNSDGSTAPREFSTASRLKRLNRRDHYSLSQDPAVTGERYAHMVSCSDGLRRDTAALRYHCLNNPEAILRLPAALNTSSIWLDNSVVSKTASRGVVPPILPLRTGSARPLAAAQRRMLSSPRVVLGSGSIGGEKGIGALVLKTKGF